VTDPARDIRAFDPFDLPDWTGTEQVCWQSEDPLSDEAWVRGSLTAQPDLRHPLDLVAVDEVYPRSATTEELRRRAHQAWSIGEVLLVERNGRVAIAAPGTRFDANAACELLRRFARAVGAPPSNVTVSIVL
jgi:hypothetical protein